MEADHETIGNLTELEFYVGDPRTVDRFTQLYAIMLNECRETGDMGTARAMQKILYTQMCYLMNQWVQEKRGASTLDRFILMEYGKWN